MDDLRTQALKSGAHLGRVPLKDFFCLGAGCCVLNVGGLLSKAHRGVHFPDQRLASRRMEKASKAQIQIGDCRAQRVVKCRCSLGIIR